MSNLPVRHKSRYVDPLIAESEQKAIATSKSNNILFAIGDKEKGEWIRMVEE